MGFEPTTLGATGRKSDVGLHAFSSLRGSKSLSTGTFGRFRRVRATDHATGRGILDGPKEALEPVRLARLVSPRIADYGSELIS
jgi:hypothetical protein